MTTLNFIVGVLASSIVGIALIGTLIAAARGKDLCYFEAEQSRNPRRYRNLIWVCRLNGPICVILAIVMTIGSISGAVSGKLSPPLLAAGTAVLSVALLWLSLRWSMWAWKRST